MILLRIDGNSFPIVQDWHDVDIFLPGDIFELDMEWIKYFKGWKDLGRQLFFQKFWEDGIIMGKKRLRGFFSNFQILKPADAQSHNRELLFLFLGCFLKTNDALDFFFVFVDESWGFRITQFAV